MSLIQEALKRHQDDSDSGGPGSPPPPVQEPSKTPAATPGPSAPPPLPTEGAEAPPPIAEDDAGLGKSTRPWPVIAGVAVVLLLLVGGGIWLVMFAIRNMGDKEGSAVTPPEKAAPAAPIEIDNTGDTEPLNVEPSTSVEPDPEDVVPVKVDEPEDEPEPEPEPLVTWPYLTINGVLGEGKTGSAVINNEIVGVDETIQDVKVVSIGNQGVQLEYMGETMFLKVGNSTQ